MRTVFATNLSVTGADDIGSALDAVPAWVQAWHRRQRIEFTWPTLEGPGEAVISAAPNHSFQLAVLTVAANPGDRLRDITWSYPDQYDRTLGWVTRLSMLEANGQLLTSLQIDVTGLHFQIVPASIRLGPPRLVYDIGRLTSARLSGQPYSTSPEVVKAEHIDLLINDLTNNDRPYPIVLVSHSMDRNVPLVDVDELAQRLAGVARVYELADRWAAFRLTEEVGKELSCYAGAVRVYWPRFTVQSNAYDHPAWMPWSLRDPAAANDLAPDLFAMCAEAAAFRHIEPPEIAAFRSAAHAEQRETRRIDASDNVESLQEQLIDAWDGIKAAGVELAALQQENATLKDNVVALSGARSAGTGRAIAAVVNPVPANAGPVEPATVAEAVTNAEALTTNLVFLPSAQESAAGSPYKQPVRVLQALLAIDEVADLWCASLGGQRSVGSFKALFRERGFEYKDDVSQTSKGKWGSEYTAVVDGETVDLSPHITIGAKQADTCISIHMNWSRERQKVLIGHVGRHKTNTKT